MNLALPPDVQAVFDDRATALLPLVVSRPPGHPAQPEMARVPAAPRTQRSTPTAPRPVQFHTDPNGLPQGWLLHTATGDTGLEGTGYR